MPSFASTLQKDGVLLHVAKKTPTLGEVTPGSPNRSTSSDFVFEIPLLIGPINFSQSVDSPTINGGSGAKVRLKCLSIQVQRRPWPFSVQKWEGDAW